MILFALVFLNLEMFVFEKLRLEQVYALLFCVILFNMQKNSVMITYIGV